MVAEGKEGGQDFGVFSDFDFLGFFEGFEDGSKEDYFKLFN